MAQQNSFDVTTGVDLQEVDNALNQARKEVGQRYDFKDAKVEINFKRAEGLVALLADNDMRMRALLDVVQSKLIRRGVPVQNLDIGDVQPAGGDTLTREITLKQSLDSDTAKKIAALIKEQKFKKVQAAILGDQVRVSAPSRDELQGVMTFLRAQDVGVALQFGNFR